MSEKTNDEQLFELIKSYTRENKEKELEVRFGINTSTNPITRENLKMLSINSKVMDLSC